MAAIKGYTTQESQQIDGFVARFKQDTRTWQERVLANARPEEREAMAAHLAAMEAK